MNPNLHFPLWRVIINIEFQPIARTMALIKTNSEFLDLVCLRDIIGSGTIPEALETAIKEHKLDSNTLIHNSILAYKKLDDLQSRKLSSIGKALIELGVESVELFNTVSPYLRGIYINGFMEASNWSTSIQLRHNTSHDNIVIENSRELLKQYYHFYPMGPSNQLKYFRSQYNSEDVEKVRVLGFKIIKRGINFIGNLKASFIKELNKCKYAFYGTRLTIINKLYGY